MLIRYIRWLKGYLTIQLIGYSPERFLNICKSKHIDVWDLQSYKNHYKMNIYIKDFKKLKPLCKKTSSRIRILEKRGLPFNLYSLQKRKCFVTGCILSFIFLFLTSHHIWKIEVQGGQKITPDVICSFLDENDIRKGTLIKNIDCKNLAAKMRKGFEDIIWVSVSIDGTDLIIELRENTDSVIVSKEEETPSDLIADCDGIVTSIITRNGIPQVQIGDEVVKGDLLVSGSIPILNDNKEIIGTNYVKADADIFVESIETYQDTIESTYKKKNYLKNSIYFEFGPIKYPMKSKNNMEVFIDNNWFKWGTLKSYQFVNDSYSESERETILQNHYAKYCDTLTSEHKVILESHFLITHYENYSIAASYLRLERQIGESRKIIDFSSEDMLQ